MRISDWSSDVCSSDLGCVASVRHVLRPVRLDLLDQFVRQRHVVERLGLVVAVGVDPLEELLGVLRGGGVLRLLVHRSEEHTSELQSLMRISYAVFCLKKKKKHYAVQLSTCNN